MSKPLSPKHQRFVAEYLKDQNATQAAIRAGYAPKWAEKNSTRLTGNDGVWTEIQSRLEAITKRAELKRQDIIEGWRRVIQADPRKMRDEHGNLKRIKDLADEEAWFLAGDETIIKNAKAGDGHTDEILKLRYVDRAKYLEAAAKHFGMLDETLNVNVTVLDARIEAGRKRLGSADSSGK